MTVYYECPKCAVEIETEFFLGEHFCDLSECEECGHKLTSEEESKICCDLEEQATGKAIDHATDYGSER